MLIIRETCSICRYLSLNLDPDLSRRVRSKRTLLPTKRVGEKKMRSRPVLDYFTNTKFTKWVCYPIYLSQLFSCVHINSSSSRQLSLKGSTVVLSENLSRLPPSFELSLGMEPSSF